MSLDGWNIGDKSSLSEDERPKGSPGIKLACIQTTTKPQEGKEWV